MIEPTEPNERDKAKAAWIAEQALLAQIEADLRSLEWLERRREATLARIDRLVIAASAANRKTMAAHGEKVSA